MNLLVARRRTIVIVSVIVLGVVLASLVGYFSLGLIVLKLGSNNYRYGNILRAKTYYQFASKFAFISKKADDRLRVIQEELNQKSESKDTITISADSIKFQNSFVFKGPVEDYSDSNTDSPDLYRRYLLGTILKNMSGYGIPVVNITKLNMFDASGKLVMTVDNPGPNVLLVKDGETPFTYYFDLRESHGITIKSFTIDLEIPPFIPNPNAVRLTITKQVLVSKIPIEDDGTQYRYKYQLTITNQTDSVVKDVSRFTLLKYNGVPLTRIGHVCCFEIYVAQQPVKTEGVLRAENLDRDNEVPATFQPGESKIVTFEVVTDEVLTDFKNQFRFNPNLVESIIYIIGMKAN